MSTAALIMMITTVTIVAVITAYFFWRVLKAPQRSEPDSFEDNDPE